MDKQILAIFLGIIFLLVCYVIWLWREKASIVEEKEKKEGELKEKDVLLGGKEGEIKRKDAELKEKDAELKEKDVMLGEKDAEIKRKDGEIKSNIELNNITWKARNDMNELYWNTRFYNAGRGGEFEMLRKEGGFVNIAPRMTLTALEAPLSPVAQVAQSEEVKEEAVAPPNDEKKKKLRNIFKK